MSPITLLRARHGLSITQLGHMLGSTYQKAWQAERGHLTSLPSGWAEPLREMGEDFNAIQREYRAWLRSEREGMILRQQARFVCGEEALAAGVAAADKALAFVLANTSQVQDGINRIIAAEKTGDFEGAREWMRGQPWEVRMTVAIVWACGSVNALGVLAEACVATTLPLRRPPARRDGIPRSQRLSRVVRRDMEPRVRKDEGGDHA